MSVTVTLTFATLAEAVAALGGMGTVSTQPDAATSKPKAEKPGKSAPADKPAASSPTATPTPAAAAEPSPASTGPAADEAAELPYAPLAERITKAIAASNPNSPANRTALKTLFAKLAERYGAPVKTGQDVKAADRGELAAVLDAIEGAGSEEAMS